MSAKVFIVTGASKGLGAAITQQLLALSHKVVVTARSQEPLEKFKKAHPGQVEVVAGDITKPEIAQSLSALAVKTFGKLDGIVICHGMLEPLRLSEDTVENYQHIYNVNVFSCLAVAKAGLDELRKSQGTIVWVSSGAASTAYGAWSAYGSSKAAINSISAHMALEEKDITSIAIAPGRVDTDMQAVVRAKGRDTMDKATYDSFAEAHTTGGLLKPEQPGNVIAKFAAEPQHDLSGKFLKWNAPEMEKYQ